MKPTKTKAGVMVSIRYRPLDEYWSVLYYPDYKTENESAEIYFLPDERTAKDIARKLVKAWGGKAQ